MSSRYFCFSSSVINFIQSQWAKLKIPKNFVIYHVCFFQGKDYEQTTFTNLQIGVENEEPLFICQNVGAGTLPPPDTVNITIKVIDINDPPQFEKDTVTVYNKEEEVPGKVLFTPNVHDVDSDISKIRSVYYFHIVNSNISSNISPDVHFLT